MVTVIVNYIVVRNTLINLGVTINMITTTILETLQLEQFLHPTPTVLELEDHTNVKLARILDDIIV